MGINSKIQWTDHTFNPWRGCTKVSAECDNCYAESMSARNPKTLGVWGKYGTRAMAAESYWKQPTAWNREAEMSGEKRRVFCASLADVFESETTMPVASIEGVKASRRRLFKTITKTPFLNWLLLTKRPEYAFMLTYQAIDPNHADNEWNEIGEPNGLSVFDYGELFPNVWLGTSVGERKTKNRIKLLATIPAAIRFLSVEPLLEDLGALDLTGIDWVIVGGESGGKKRPFNADWARSIRDQCKEQNVAFFMKQIDKVQLIPDDLMIREFPVATDSRAGADGNSDRT